VRRLAVAAVERGFSYAVAGGLYGVSADAVGRWYRAYAADGEAALAARKRGRRPGEQMVLTGGQQERVKKAIEGGCPDQYMLEFCLWTREAVRDLVVRWFGVELAARTIGDYLARWNFTPQRPVQRAYEQNPEAVERWLNEDYPALVERARREKAVIMWQDEMGLRSDETGGRSFSPAGKTPVVRKAGRRFSVNLIHAVGNRGELSFRVFEGKFVAKVFIDFLDRLIRNRRDGRKVFLVVDGHPVHRAKKVTQWAEARRDRIELVFLPGYSPELNPAEVANHDFKAFALSHNRPRTKTELVNLVRRHLHRRQKEPWVVRCFFLERHVRYAIAHEI
jgi:transposase